MEPELGKRANPGLLAETSFFDGQFGTGSWQFLEQDPVEPHAALTDVQREEVEQAAKATSQHRESQMKALRELLGHVEKACGELAVGCSFGLFAVVLSFGLLWYRWSQKCLLSSGNFTLKHS